MAAATGASPPVGPSTPVALGTARGRWLLTTTVLASGMAFLDATAVTVALPAIGRDLGASVAGLQWTVSGYTLSLAALIMLGGALGDRYGRRRVFLVGVAWFAAASLLCGLARSPGQLIAARVVQGIGGALLTPGSLALIQSSFRPLDRPRAIALWSALGGIAGLVGPFLGGVLVDTVSWRLVFLVNVPVAAFLVGVSGRQVPESRSPGEHGRFDVAGAALGAAALGSLTYALIRAGEAGAGADVVVAGSLALLAGAAFVAWERRVAEPMLPPSLFADRAFSGTNVATLLVYGALGGGSFFLVLQLQLVLGYDAALAGAALLPSSALLILLSPQAARVAQRVGARVLMTAGPLVTAAGALTMSGIDGQQPYVLDVLPGTLLQGLGMATTVAPLTATVLAAAPESLTGVASGVNNAVARAAQLLAVAALPVAVGLSGSAQLRPEVVAAGFRTALHECAVLFALGGVVSWLTVPRDALRRPRE